MTAAPAPDDQSDVIAFLSRPQAYGLADDAEVMRIDTHGAVVFLVGDRVYKLKRAVTFPFLDFSTEPRRRRFCADEVSLNRRTASDLYLGVAPVFDHEGALRLGDLLQPADATYPARDWLVVMRRFDQNMLLASLADRGELSSSLIASLARTIADFHASAKPEPGHGGAEVLRHTVKMDVSQMVARGETLDTALSRELAALMPAEAERCAAMADRRQAAGAVRRCHGDLHLKNIYFDQGRPVPFDCIEFNDRLSCIDVLYDLSFLLMDLDFRGLREQASVALNTYLWHSREPDEELLTGLALLPIYLARRSAIRAHVDAASVAHISDPTEAVRERDLARAYQRYARGLFPPQSPRLVAVGGLSGSGKTTLAVALAPLFGAAPGAVVLRSDVVRKRLAGVALDQHMPPGWYTLENAATVYELVHRLACIALAAGRSVILDGVYSRPSERQAAEAVARRSGVPFAGFWLEGPAGLLRQRVNDRHGDASDATAAVVDRQAGYDIGQLHWARLDATLPVEVLARQACGALPSVG